MVIPFPLNEEEKNVMIMTTPSPLLEKREMVIMVIPFPLKEKEKNVMIMTIPSPLLEKKEMMAMVRPFSLKEKEEMVVMTTEDGQVSQYPGICRHTCPNIPAYADMCMAAFFWKRARE